LTVTTDHTAAEPADSARDPRLGRIGERATAAGLDAWWTQFRNPATGTGEGPRGLRISFPAGRATRDLHVDADDVPLLERYAFEQWTFLTGYDAILDRAAGDIYAAVELRGSTYQVAAIPGAERLTWDQVHAADNDGLTTAGVVFPVRLTAGRDGGRLVVELRCPAHGVLRAAAGRHNGELWGLRISGSAISRHDDAVRLLSEVSTTFFVDLDIAYGVSGRVRHAVEIGGDDGDWDKPAPSTLPPRLPPVRYPVNAARLYSFARSVSQMPLLEYLAYYQVIEYFLPTYAHTIAVRRLRAMLNDPRFDPQDETALAGVVDMLSRDGRGSTHERDHVRAVLVACVDEAQIRSFLDHHPAAARALADKKHITGIRPVTPKDTTTGIVDQVAARIYDLRCRIVHAKDSAEAAREQLRPFDRQAQNLRHDLNLVRFVAQRVLITSAQPATWP
jgi:hypothetical protein